MVELYLFINGNWTLVDYGTNNKTDVYIAQGYLVRYIVD